MSNEYRPTGFRILPPVVKNLLIINAICYLANLVVTARTKYDLNLILGIWNFQSGYFRIWQPLTYMFMHGGFDHLFLNMFSLWMFGNTLENVWGSKRFLFYYLISGIGAGLVFCIITPFLNQLGLPSGEVSVGASGAIYALLLGFGMLFPNERVYLYFFIPLKAKWFVIGMAVLELYEGIFRTGDGIAHFAHLGGMLVGLIIILVWKKKGNLYS